MNSEGTYRTAPACPECDKKNDIIRTLSEEKRALTYSNESLQRKIEDYEDKDASKKVLLKNIVGLFRTVMVGLVFLSFIWAGNSMVIDQLDNKILVGQCVQIFLVLFGIAVSICVVVLAIAYESKLDRKWD